MNYSIKPSEKDIRESNSIVKGVIETCRIIEEVDNLSVELGWTSEDFILEELDGCQAFAKSGDTLKIGFNTSEKGWKDALKFSTATGYGKALYLGSKDYKNQDIDFIWEKVLFEGFSLVFANEALGNITETSPFSLEYGEKEKTEEVWRVFSDNLEKSMRDTEDLDEEIFEGRNFEIIGYKICKELAKDYSLDEIPELNKVRLIEAGERLFI